MNDFKEDELIIFLMWGIEIFTQLGEEKFKNLGQFDLFHKLQDLIVNYESYDE